MHLNSCFYGKHVMFLFCFCFKLCPIRPHLMHRTFNASSCMFYCATCFIFLRNFPPHHLLPLLLLHLLPLLLPSLYPPASCFPLISPCSMTLLLVFLNHLHHHHLLFLLPLRSVACLWRFRSLTSVQRRWCSPSTLSSLWGTTSSA